MPTFEDISKLLETNDYETIESYIEGWGYSETINGAIYHNRARLHTAQQGLDMIRANLSIHARSMGKKVNPKVAELISTIDIYSAIIVGVFNALPDEDIINSIISSRNKVLIIQIIEYINSALNPFLAVKTVRRKFNLEKSKSYRIIYLMIELGIVESSMQTKRGTSYRLTREGRKIAGFLEEAPNMPIFKLASNGN